MYDYIWYDEPSFSFDPTHYVYVEPEEQLLAYMGLPTKYSKLQLALSKRWDEMVLKLITG